jgi:hypothetical protein
MSVPLDRLYNHLDGLCNHDILIYRFMPHGSKKLEDLHPLVSNNDWLSRLTTPLMICHDQEPLNYKCYTVNELNQATANYPWPPELREIASRIPLRGITGLPQNCFDLVLLTHSEMHSSELLHFEQNGFVGVYWWSHAVIARDWYRYAQYDTDLVPKLDDIQSDFLIYNRAWSGTREYRLKFSELIVNHNLQTKCRMKFNAQDQTHYRDHEFLNTNLTINRYDLEDFFEINNNGASSSANYMTEDYSQVGMEIVLETLFDDTRWHLTEKALRPIACGRPFMLAATPGSLQYLRRYGFKTFGEFINEDYDLIQDPVQRLEAITKEMQRIANLESVEKRKLWGKLYDIAHHNQLLFFSDAWHTSIFAEFVNNANHALDIMWQNRSGKYWVELRSKIKKDFYDPSGIIKSHPTEKLLDWLRADIPKIKASV